jgi:hypothetical protein
MTTRLSIGKSGSKSIDKMLDTYLPSAGTPVNAVAAQGTLTIAEPVTADDSIIIGGVTYTFVTGTTSAPGEIGLGAGEAATKLAIVAAINGTDTFNTANPLVTAAAFSGDACVLTAKTKGVAGNSIGTVEVLLTHASNVFDATTLGTTTAGVDGTVAPAGKIMFTSSKIYIATADNNIDDANWKSANIA